MEIKINDLQFIEQQLRRKPRGVIELSTRCKTSHPQVIKTKPIFNKEIFPTLYYLVCSNMIDKVSKLEAQSYIKELQEKIDSNQDFKDRFLVAQENYKRERNTLVENPSQLNESQKEALKSGIGGVAKFDKIKCLHCHLAHYLATGFNVVGEEVANKVGSTC